MWTNILDYSDAPFYFLKDQWYANPKSRHIAILRGADIYTVDVVAGDGVISEELLSSLIDASSIVRLTRRLPKFLGNLCMN